MANYFMPSEVARLILGYLIDRGLSNTMKTFLQECKDLAEFSQVMNTGKVPPTTIMGQSLLDILNEFAELKLKAVRSGQLKVPTATPTECSSRERDAIISAREQAEKAIKHQRLLWRERKSRQAARAREQNTNQVGGSVGITTPVSSCRQKVCTEKAPVSTPRYEVIVSRTSAPTSSRISNPEVISASVTSHVTVPGYALSIPSHINSASTLDCVTNHDYADTEPVTSVVAIGEVENIIDIQAEVPDVPAAQTNLDTRLQLGLDAKYVAGPSQANTAAEENADLLDWMLEETHFHEKLAENINTVLLGCDPSQLKNRVGTLSDTSNKDLASMISKGFNINQIIERTESDPSFQNFIQIFQQGTAIPLTQFDVPVISTEATTCQSGLITLPTAAKTTLSQTDSCKSPTVEPVNYRGDAPVLAPTRSVSFQPSNILHSVGKQTSLLNPCDAERLGQEMPCGIDAIGVSETRPVVSWGMLEQIEVGDSYTQNRADPLHHSIVIDGDSKDLTGPNLTSSLQLETSGCSQKCAESSLNSVPDQMVILGSTGSEKSVISENCLQGSSEQVTSRNSFFPPNENSLTVFSLIEKSIAEMNGEEFVHRSMRNSPSYQTAVSMDAHSSGGNRNEGGEHLSTKAACNNTSKVEICCEDIAKNSIDNHARTENCQDSNINTGSINIEKSTSINFNICSTQNAPAFLTETAIKENVGAFEVGSPTDVRTSDPDERVLACMTAIHVCDKSCEPRPAFNNKLSDNGVNPETLCQNDHTASTTKKHGINIDGSTCVSDTAVDSSLVKITSGKAVIGAHETCVGVSTPRNMRYQLRTSHNLLKLAEQSRDNSTIGPGKKDSDKSCNSVCKENNQHCSRNGDLNCTLSADCPVLRETDKIEAVEEIETNARKACVPDKELCVDDQEPFCMSPPLRKPSRLRQSMAQRHTKKTCINKQTEGKRSQSLCDCSTASNSLDGQNTTADGNSVNHFLEKHAIMTSAPDFPLNVTDNNTHERLSASIHPQTSCSSLPATLTNVPAPGSPNFSQSCNLSVKQALEMTPPQGKQLLINSTEDNQTQAKTVKRRVIAFHSEHSPFIPDHCKKNPSRRIAPKEVDYSTPSPLQDCPSSPMSYMVDVSVSQPNSPLNSKEGVLRPLASGKSLPPLNGHIRINPQRSIEASCQNEDSTSCSGAQPQTTEGQQKVKTSDVCLSHLVKLGIKLPPSPSKRKPRRITPVQLSSGNKDWSGVTRSSSFVSHGGYSPVVDESRIVSSTSDITTSSEEEAFRLLKSFLSSSYSKPQPRQEITSTYQKAGVSKCVHTPKSNSKHKARGKKTSPVKENAVLTTTEANDSSISEENAFVAGDCGSTRGQCLAESVLSSEDSANKACSSGSVKGQPTVSLSHSKGNLPVKNGVYKVQCVHNATHSSVSPCSIDSDMSFAPVGIMECFSSESDKQVQVTDNCKVTTVGSSSSSYGTVCENAQNSPCLAKSQDDTSRGSSEVLCTSGELRDNQNDVSVHSKVCVETHKTTLGTEQMRVVHSKVCAETLKTTPDTEQMRVVHSKVCAETHKTTPETGQIKDAHSNVCAETHKTTLGTEQMRVVHSKVCAETLKTTLDTEQMRVVHSKVYAETHKTTPETGQIKDAHSKICAETHKTTPETGQMRVALASVDVDQMSINSASQTKSADSHCLPVSKQGAMLVKKPTNSVETDAVGLVKNVNAFSNTETLPSMSIVANRAENKACIHSTSTVNSLSSASSSEQHHIATSADSLMLKNSDPAVSPGSYVTQLTSSSLHQHSNGSPPPAQLPSKMLNVSDGVTDAVYSLLSLCSSIDSKMATNIVSLSDENLSRGVGDNQVMATNIVSLSDENLSRGVGDNQVMATKKLPMNNADLTGHCLSTAVPMSVSLLQGPMMASDVSLPSFISSSLRLAHNIENVCEVSTNCSSPPPNYSYSDLAGQDAIRSSENVHEVHISKKTLRPCSPSSLSLLSRAMVDSGIPCDGSNLTSLDTWTSNGDGVCHMLPVLNLQAPDVPEAANAHDNTVNKRGRKPHSKAQKPDYTNVAKIVPSLGIHNFELTERCEIEGPVPSGSFVKILPRASQASNAVLKPQAMDTQPKSSSFGQIQIIPSANGPIIVIPPGLEGIIQNLLSENNKQSSQVSHTQNNNQSPQVSQTLNNQTARVSHIENNLHVENECMQPSNMGSTKSISTSCNENISNLNPSMPAVTMLQTRKLQCQPHSESVGLEMAEKSGSCSRNRRLLSSSSTNKLEQSSAGLHSAIEEDGKHKSDRLSSCDGVQLPKASNYKCARKIAVRRRDGFTYLRSSKKSKRRKSKKKKCKAIDVADCVDSVKQHHSSNVVVASGIKGGKSLSFMQAPGIEQTAENMACEVRKNCTEGAVQNEQTEGANEVKSQSENCAVQGNNEQNEDFVQGDLTDEVCEINRPNARADRYDNTKRSCEVKKNGQNCSSQSEKAGSKYEVRRNSQDCAGKSDKAPALCDDKSNYNSVSQKGKPGMVCEVKKSDRGDADRRDKQSVVCEVKKKGRGDNRGDKTAVVCEVKENDRCDADRRDEQSVVCEVKKSDRGDDRRDKQSVVCEVKKSDRGDDRRDKQSVVCEVKKSDRGDDRRDKQSVVCDVKKSGRGDDRRDKQSVVCEVKKSDRGDDRRDKQSVVCEVKKSDRGDDRRDKQSVVCEVKKSDRGDDRRDKQSVVCDVKKSGRGDDRRDKQSVVCEVKKSDRGDDRRDKQSVVCEVNKSDRGDDRRDKQSVVCDVKKSDRGDDRRDKQNVVCDVKKSDRGDDRRDKQSVVCKVNKSDRGDDRRDKQSVVVCDVNKSNRGDDRRDKQSVVVCKVNKSDRGDDRRDKQSVVVCDVNKSGKGDDRRDEQSVVWEVKKSGRGDDRRDKTAVVCDDIKRCNTYTGQKCKTGVVCEFKKSDINRSDTTDLAAKYNRDSKIVVSCKKAEKINEKADNRISRSGENRNKSRGDKLLLSGDESEDSSYKDISSRESTKANNGSTRVKEASISDMPILKKLLLEDRAEKRTGISLKEHSSSLLNVKSSDSSKPSRNNSKVKAANINQKQPAIQNTIEDSRKINNALPSCVDQSTICVSDTDSSPTKSTHTVPRQRKRKGTNPDVAQSDCSFKKIKLQVPIYKPVIQERHVSAKMKSVRIVVDNSGENITVGNVRSENSDVLIISETEEEKEQCNNLEASSQPKSKNKPVVKRCRTQNKIKVCNNNTIVNTSVTEGGTAQPAEKKVEGDGKTSTMPGECQYIGSMPFCSLFSIFDKVYPQGNNLSQSSLAPAKQSPKRLQHKHTDTPSVARKSHGHSTSRDRKTKVAAPSEKVLPEHKEHTNTSDPAVPGTSRGCTASQNRKSNSRAASAGDVGRGKRKGIPRKLEICNRGNETHTAPLVDVDCVSSNNSIKYVNESHTASLVDVDCVSSNNYDKETQDAVSALELCMREAPEYTHHFHKQPERLCEVSSQVNIDHSAVTILEEIMCQMSNSSTPTKKSQPCHSNDASSIKLNLPPKKRLSSEFIVNGTVDTQFHHDQNSLVLSDNDSHLSVNKVTACWSHPLSVGPSEVHDSSKPKICSYIEAGAACHEPLTENSVLHSSQPTSLDKTNLNSQTNLLSTGASDKTTDSSPVPQCREVHVTSVTELQTIQPLHTSSIDKTTNLPPVSQCHEEVQFTSVTELQTIQPSHSSSIDKTTDSSAVSQCREEVHVTSVTELQTIQPSHSTSIDNTSVPQSREEAHVISVSEVYTIQPSHSSSIDNTNTGSLQKFGSDQSPLSNNSLGEQHKQSSTSSSIVSSDRRNPSKRGYDISNIELTLEDPSVNKCELCTVLETNVTPQTACIPSAGPAQLDETHPASRQTMVNKVDKLLRKLHKKKKMKHL